jgi:hypothetical protein
MPSCIPNHSVIAKPTGTKHTPQRVYACNGRNAQYPTRNRAKYSRTQNNPSRPAMAPDAPSTPYVDCAGWKRRTSAPWTRFARTLLT